MIRAYQGLTRSRQIFVAALGDFLSASQSKDLSTFCQKRGSGNSTTLRLVEGCLLAFVDSVRSNPGGFRMRSSLTTALAVALFVTASCARDPETLKREYVASGDRYVAQKK